MKKVAILTITNSGMNFGNRLQNYALQEALKRCGADVSTIRSAKSVNGSLLLSKCRLRLKKIIKNSKRRKIYSKFENANINYDSMIRFENINESDFADRYEVFVSGSDQVWNPYFHFNSDFEFASFAPREKRYSYAASIGVSEIDDSHRDKFSKNLKGMKTISVREEDSVVLVEKLTGIRPMLHVDPTLLLDEEDYFGIEEKPDYPIPENYLFMYYLGNVSDVYRAKVQEIADEKELKIIEFTETAGEPYYNIGPQHFLYLIHHASYICTDSYHGTVFSMLFEKHFTIFVRQDRDVPMNSRIETLVNTFNIQDRLLENMNSNYYCDMNYEEVKKILDTKRKEAYAYLSEICN